MAKEKVRIVIKDVCRIVGGSVSQARDKDMDGKPFVIKTGVNAGKPTTKRYIAVAVPKQPGHTHWAHTEWGAKIWAIGHAAFPGIAQSPNFAWKIDDGDSQVPNTKGKKPSDNPNNRGCWVLHCSTQLPIKACSADGTVDLPPESVKTGYYVQIAVMVQGNDSGQKPGIYLNPEIVALQGGEAKDEIQQGVDASTLGFGGVALPPGVNAPPNLLTGAGAPPLPGTPGAAVPPLPGTGTTSVPPLPGVPGTAVAVPPLPGAAVAPPPNPAILAVPAAPPAPPAVAGPQMTAKAGVTPYATFIASGWTDALLRQHGYIV